ncbi:hypothetical protein SEMRO_30_G019720.1 [Seminavis robusta]|uniref:Uncharacterized protein n=1 Tax=Seminavis robusta TaxID=568900 RepID=A0A9N8DA50_9STRA|nr:hypothetical protein SEMRO_30_G019720.1 [Seminavis robusta]|eukprot:Sro30_g019720.1 n/a (228) ;mRNA; f:109241-109983
MSSKHPNERITQQGARKKNCNQPTPEGFKVKQYADDLAVLDGGGDAYKTLPSSDNKKKPDVVDMSNIPDSPAPDVVDMSNILDSPTNVDKLPRPVTVYKKTTTVQDTPAHANKPPRPVSANKKTIAAQNSRASTKIAPRLVTAIKKKPDHANSSEELKKERENAGKASELYKKLSQLELGTTDEMALGLVGSSNFFQHDVLQNMMTSMYNTGEASYGELLKNWEKEE